MDAAWLEAAFERSAWGPDAAWLEVDRLGLGLPGSSLTMEGSQMRLEDRSVM